MRPLLALFLVFTAGEIRGTEAAPDSIALVRRFADAMIEKSRANLPHPDVPLFPIALTRDKFQIPRFKVGNLVTARVPQEFKTIANIHHDLNLYQLFYALGKISGEAKYAREADRVVDYFLKHCQEPKYGFFCWGEHLGWDVLQNAPGGFRPDDPQSGMIHEFYRPWIFWDKSWRMAPEACHRFAQALWRHQIDHTGGKVSFSRHAMISSKTPSRRGMDFPRHGGFYIAAWGADYRHTKDPEILEAIEKLVAMYESCRDPESGAIPHGSGDFAFDKDGRKTQYIYTQSPLGLAIELHDAAPAMPEALKQRMIALAESADKAFLATPHDPGPGGKGFVLFCDPTTLQPAEYWQSKEELDAGKPPRRIPYTGGWRSAYTGQHPHTWLVPTLIARHQQTGNEGYKKLLTACADHYLTADPDAGLNEPVKEGQRAPDIESGSIGNVIVLLNAAFKLTQDEKYLARAEWFTAWATRKFWPDDSPLPHASVRENLYSAASRSDTLALAMLQTALLRTQPEKERELGLIATDR
ncbi:MAG: hypothetical protein HS117_09000 [Verrucomicrobiaceae bacterium]|nr:hypothetical protein [Verrucomicrobiaceae bacterium]